MGETKKKQRRAPATELYPGHAAELKKHAKRGENINAAAAKPLPGPLLDAFAPVPRTIGGLTVRPLVHYDFVILQQLDSPLLEHLKGKTKKATPYTDEHGYEMVLQFTRPVREAAALVAKGAKHFREVAVGEIGMALGPVEVGLLVKAVEREFIRAFSTAVNYSPKSEEEGTVFTPPPPAPTTASAGG